MAEFERVNVALTIAEQYLRNGNSVAALKCVRLVERNTMTRKQSRQFVTICERVCKTSDYQLAFSA